VNGRVGSRLVSFTGIAQGIRVPDRVVFLWRDEFPNFIVSSRALELVSPGFKFLLIGSVATLSFPIFTISVLCYEIRTDLIAAPANLLQFKTARPFSRGKVLNDRRAGTSAQHQGHGDLPHHLQDQTALAPRPLFSQTGTLRKAAQLAGCSAKKFLRTPILPVTNSRITDIYE
jgi:hypothetical protein